MDVAAHQDAGEGMAHLLADPEQADGAAFGEFGAVGHANLPLPLMGRDRGGVEFAKKAQSDTSATPTHEQVRVAPRPEAMSGGHGDLLISPFKGEGFR